MSRRDTHDKVPAMADTDSMPAPDIALPPEVVAACKDVTVATLTTVLLKRGLRNIWIRGSFRIAGAHEKIAGPAFTLRYVPAREDLATPASWTSPVSTRAAIEAMPAGCICVAGVGQQDAAVSGDILCTRMRVRGVAGLVADGPMRDIEGVRATGFDVWATGIAAPPSIVGNTFAGWQQPVGCGGVAVIPGDLIVADADGAVVVPRAMIAEVLEQAKEQEKLEAWILEQIENGAALPGLYPLSDENRKKYEAERKNNLAAS